MNVEAIIRDITLCEVTNEPLSENVQLLLDSFSILFKDLIPKRNKKGICFYIDINENDILMEYEKIPNILWCSNILFENLMIENEFTHEEMQQMIKYMVMVKMNKLNLRRKDFDPILILI